MMRHPIPSLAPEFDPPSPVATLRDSPLFAGLPTADIVKIACIAVAKTLESGEYLFREDRPSHGFYIVQRGAIDLHRVNAAGKEQVIHVFRAGESLGEETVATQTGYAADARAVEPSQVLLVRKAEFLNLLKARPELALRILGSMAMQWRQLICKFEDCTLKDVETRFANWLLQRCPDADAVSPVTIQLSAPKRVIAAELGMVSETFSRTLAKFRDARILSVNSEKLTLLNPARLKQLFGAGATETLAAA